MLIQTMAAIIKKHHKPDEDFLSYMVEKLCSRASGGLPADEVKGYVLALNDTKNTLNKFEKTV